MIIKIVAFAVVLGVLIFFHELGHFLMAKWVGIRVERFSLGFGPRIVGFTRGETEYCISALPLGGYVKMTGENPDEPLEGKPWEFGSRTIWERSRVVVCGPGMNLVLAVLFLAIPFMLGKQIPAYLEETPVVGWISKDTPAEKAGFKIGDRIISVDGNEVKDWQDFEIKVATQPKTEMHFQVERDGQEVALKATTEEIGSLGMGSLGIGHFIPARIGSINEGYPAQAAGLRKGDTILEVDGQPMEHWYELANMIHDKPDTPIRLTVLRDTGQFNVEVTPVSFSEGVETPRFKRLSSWIKGLFGYTEEISKKEAEKKEEVEVQKFGLIGIGPYEQMVTKKYGIFGSLKKGFTESVRLTMVTFEFLYRLIAGRASPKSLGGPIMIFQVAGEAAKSGLVDLINFMGFLSLQLGILNLFPIPVLDGGHLLFFGMEFIKRKPLSMRTREIAQQAGMALLILLMVYVFYNDILRYFFR